MLKSLGASLAFKIALGVGVVALVAGGGAALLNDSSPTQKVSTGKANTEREKSLVGVHLAAAAQDDYETACQARVKRFESKMKEGMDRFAAEHPEFMPALPDATLESPDTLCTLDWKTLVGDSCTSAVAEHPKPPAEVLAALPEGLRALVADPCNADWANVDWAGAMNDFDPAAMMKAACAAGQDQMPAMEGKAFSEGLGFKKFCASDFDFSAFTDFDWNSVIDGKMPSHDEIEKLKEQFGLSDLMSELSSVEGGQ